MKIAAILLATFALAPLAQADCDTQLKLSCQVSYYTTDNPTYDGLTGFEGQFNSTNFQDEHSDEPSLSNCAAQVYAEDVKGVVFNIHAARVTASNKIDIHSTIIQTVGVANPPYGAPVAYADADASGVIGQSFISSPLINVPKAFASSVGSISLAVVNCIAK